MTQILKPSLFLFLYLFGAQCALGSWQKQESRTLAWLRSVYFLDERVGWVVGSNGTILSTRDAGRTWEQNSRFTENNILDVHFSDLQNGWLLCEQNSYRNESYPASYMLRTDDGGHHWERIDFNGLHDRLIRLFFSNDGFGFAVGEGGGLWQMLDDKRSWKRVQLPVRNLILAGRLIDDFNGILVGGGGTILFTTDGGVQWTGATLLRKPDRRFNSVFFIDQMRGWTVGAGGNVYFTTDKGHTWRSQNSGVTEDLTDVWFVDANMGYAVGDRGTIIRTINGGTSWDDDNSRTKGRLERVFFVGKKGFAVGYGGIVLTTNLASDSGSL
jgi:photosystem II stability/assembly factor-like uncharacterized protein